MSNLVGHDDSSAEVNEADEMQKSIDEIVQTMIKPGEYSFIEGLLQRTELNGVRVHVIKWNGSKERWKVEILETKEKVMTKPKNLLPCFEQQATLELKDFVDEIRALTVQEAMSPFLERNDRRSAWNIIGQGYRVCPMLIWYQAFEINDRTCGRPLLVRYAKSLQQPISSTDDQNLVCRMKNILRRSEEDYIQPVHVNDFFHYEDHEKLDHPEDKPVIYWFLVYAQLDSEDWLGALESLVRIFTDIASGQWPTFFWTEALYLKALVDFGLGKQSECKRTLFMYDSIAHPLDRNRRDASMLQLWINNATPEDFQTRLELEAARIKELGGSDTLSMTSYTCARVAEVLEAELISPFDKIADLLRKEWNTVGGMPRFVREKIDTMNAPGYPYGVTMRFRISREKEKREQEEHDKMMMEMYEDRY